MHDVDRKHLADAVLYSTNIRNIVYIYIRRRFVKYLAEGARAAAVRLDRRHGLRKQLRAAKAVSICTFVR